jgi:hypothetical protein
MTKFNYAVCSAMVKDISPSEANSRSTSEEFHSFYGTQTCIAVLT